MKKRIASAVISGLFFFGCNPSDSGNGGCGPESNYFDINGLSIKTYAADSIQFSNFYLDVAFGVRYYSATKPRFSFIPEAQATSPCPIQGYLGSQEKLAELYLIALSDFNQDFHAGDTINSLVMVQGRSLNGWTPLQDFIDGSRNEGIKEQYPLLRLTQKPDAKVKQAFRLVVKLQNGEAYTAETKPIKVY
jgi:hypothetical protein